MRKTKVFRVCIFLSLTVLGSCSKPQPQIAQLPELDTPSLEEAPVDDVPIGMPDMVAKLNKALKMVEAELRITIEPKPDLFEVELFELKDAIWEDNSARIVKSSELQMLLLVLGTFAKFSATKNAVLFSSERQRSIQDILPNAPHKVVEQFLMMLMVHESVHAAQNQIYDFNNKANQILKGNTLMAYAAVIEGHAQYVTQRVCESNGLEHGFETYLRLLSSLPEAGDPLLDATLKQNAAAIASCYIDGAEFIKQVYAQGGEEAIKKVFDDPPEHIGLIERPEIYLESGNGSLIVMESKLKPLLTKYKNWEYSGNDRTRRQVMEGLGEIADESELEIVSSQLRQAWTAQLDLRESYDRQKIAVGVLIFDTPSAAELYRELILRASKKIDETDLVKWAEYETIKTPFKGHYYKKQTAGTVPPLDCTIVSVGPVAIEYVSIPEMGKKRHQKQLKTINKLISS